MLSGFLKKEKNKTNEQIVLHKIKRQTTSDVHLIHAIVDNESKFRFNPAKPLKSLDI